MSAPPKINRTSPTVDQLFPREHLIAADLTKPIAVTISGLEIRNFTLNGHDLEKAVIFFVNARRYLILNKTQALVLQSITGSENLLDWVGTRIVLTPAIASNGKPTIAITPAPHET